MLRALFLACTFLVTCNCSTVTPTPTPIPSATPTPSPPINLTCNFFASPTGGGDGLSFGSPTTFTAAQTLARGAPNDALHRVVCLENGTYTLGSTTFSALDNNETWVSYSGQNGATLNATTGTIAANPTNNLTFYGINFTGLNGAGGGVSGLYLSGSNITLRWNTFTNCASNCGYGGGLTNSTIDSNTYTGETGPGGESPIFIGGYSIFAGSNNDTFSHNLCTNMAGGCFAIQNGSGNSTNDVMSCNLAVDTLHSAGDTGAFYFTDEGRPVGTSTNVQIINNSIVGSGSGNGGLVGSTKGIYLDDNASNTTVSGNIIAQHNNSGSWPATFGIFIHGGSNNFIQNNIIQVANSLAFPTPVTSYTDFLGVTSHGVWGAAFQGCATCSPSGGVGSGTNNKFISNIVFTNAAWSGDALWYIQGTSTSPTVSTNDYFSGTGAVLLNYGYNDSNPFHLDPQFTPTNGFTVGNSAVISSLGWTQIPNCQGPLTYGVSVH